MIPRVPSPATLAARTKSRLRSDSAWPRRIRASIAQVVRPRISTMITGPRVGTKAEITISSGSVGMTRKMFVTRLIDVVDPAAAVGGEQPERRGDHGRRDRRERRDGEGRARAPDDLGEDVVALVGRAEPEVPVRRLAGQADDVGRRVLREQRRGESRGDDAGEDDDAGARLPVRQQQPEPARKAQPPAPAARRAGRAGRRRPRPGRRPGTRARSGAIPTSGRSARAGRGST